MNVTSTSTMYFFFLTFMPHLAVLREPYVVLGIEQGFRECKASTLYIVLFYSQDFQVVPDNLCKTRNKKIQSREFPNFEEKSEISQFILDYRVHIHISLWFSESEIFLCSFFNLGEKNDSYIFKK